MKTIHQLLRRPAKTIAGILLVALAVAILTVGAGQGIAAAHTMRALDAQFDTVALTTRAYNDYSLVVGEDSSVFTGSANLPEEVAAWIGQAVAENPDIVKLDSRPGLASAYIPELTPDNFTRHEYHPPTPSVNGVGSSTPWPQGAPHTCTLLEITVSSIEERMGFQVDPETGNIERKVSGSTILGTIERVHARPENCNDPTGWTADLTMYFNTPEELAGIGLEVGKRYLVYGMDYFDADWQCRGAIKATYENQLVPQEVIIDAFDPERITYYSEEEIERNGGRYAGEYRHGYKIIYLTPHEITQIRSITMSDLIFDLEFAPLEGSAEDFLASPEGAQWAEYLDYAEVNAHAFPLIGVDDLGYIASFAQETARVVEGRDFTEEELAGGAKVCVMAQSLAAANGLSVGDTIDVRYYNFDPERERDRRISDGLGTTDPAAYFYGATTPFAGDAETYTIVGLYRYDAEWGDPQEDLYSFTPNTIFVPKSSVTGTMDYGDQAFFRSIVLENGKIAEFSQLVEGAGYEGLFAYYDQGYSEIAGAFHDYETAAMRAALVGGLAYGVIFLLFLLLFPARQKKTLATMNSLGADWRQKYRHVVLSAAAILIPGTAVGTAIGALLWRRVLDALLASAETTIAVEGGASAVLPAAALQLIFALCLTALLALPMSTGGNKLKRRHAR